MGKVSQLFFNEKILNNIIVFYLFIIFLSNKHGLSGRRILYSLFYVVADFEEVEKDQYVRSLYNLSSNCSFHYLG